MDRVSQRDGERERERVCVCESEREREREEKKKRGGIVCNPPRLVSSQPQISPDVLGLTRLSPPRLWDIECGACLRVLEGHEELFRCIRFDNKRIVSGAYDG